MAIGNRETHRPKNACTPTHAHERIQKRTQRVARTNTHTHIHRHTRIASRPRSSRGRQTLSPSVRGGRSCLRACTTASGTTSSAYTGDRCAATASSAADACALPTRCMPPVALRAHVNAKSQCYQGGAGSTVEQGQRQSPSSHQHAPNVPEETSPAFLSLHTIVASATQQQKRTAQIATQTRGRRQRLRAPQDCWTVPVRSAE